MRLAQTLCLAASLTAGFLMATYAKGQTSPVQTQITEYEQKLTDARAAGQVHAVGLDLIILGYLYRQSGDLQKGLADLNEALPIEQNTNNQAGRALAMNTLGKIYSDTGEEDRALDLFRQVLAIWDQLGIKPAEALVLNNIATTYNNLGQRDEAIKYLDQSLDFWNSLGEQGEGKGSKRMLGTRQRMRDIGQWKGLKELNDALPSEVKEQLGRDGEARTLELVA
jgi:tetratricopeptide (TPR) repeat protein